MHNKSRNATYFTKTGLFIVFFVMVILHPVGGAVHIRGDKVAEGQSFKQVTPQSNKRNWKRFWGKLKLRKPSQRNKGKDKDITPRVLTGVVLGFILHLFASAGISIGLWLFFWGTGFIYFGYFLSLLLSVVIVLDLLDKTVLHDKPEAKILISIVVALFSLLVFQWFTGIPAGLI